MSSFNPLRCHHHESDPLRFVLDAGGLLARKYTVPRSCNIYLNIFLKRGFRTIAVELYSVTMAASRRLYIRSVFLFKLDELLNISSE